MKLSPSAVAALRLAHSQDRPAGTILPLKGARMGSNNGALVLAALERRGLAQQGRITPAGRAVVRALRGVRVVESVEISL